MGNFAIEEAKALLAKLKEGVVALETLLGLVQPATETAPEVAPEVAPETPAATPEAAPAEAETPAV